MKLIIRGRAFTGWTWGAAGKFQRGVAKDVTDDLAKAAAG